MKIQTNYQPLFASVDRSFREAAGDTLQIARAEASRHSRTGQHAASLRMSSVSGAGGERQTVRIGSSLEQARAVEIGADVGPRRGPHMQGIRALQTAAGKFPEHMTRRLREGLR